MNEHEMDDLDRALMALPLDEAPPTLRARVMAATVYRPRPLVRAWEVWLIGAFAAVAMWLAWSVASAPNAGGRVVEAFATLVERGGLTSVGTLLWIAIGASAVLWASQLTIPAPRRVRVR